MEKYGQCLSKEEIEKIRESFNRFDNDDKGKIDPKELKSTIISLGLENKNPMIYQVFNDLDTPENERNGGISFEDLIRAINARLAQNESEEEFRRVFDLIIGDSNSDTITFESLRRVARELGDEMSDEELKNLIHGAAKNKRELTFEDFCDIFSRRKYN